MLARFRLVAAALIGGCSAPPSTPADDGVIRLSTSIGIEPVSPSVTATMTRSLLDLVYQQGEQHVVRVEPAGDRFRLVVKEGGPTTPVLAQTLRYAKLRNVEASGRDLLVTTTDGAAPEIGDLYFELGPFEQASYSPEKLVLRRRGGEGVQRIEVLAVPTQEEEWRRFLAREVDFSLYMTPGTLTHVRDVPSVRVVPCERVSDVALFFRVKSPIFADLDMRRYVAGSLRRGAIAQIATGDRATASPSIPAATPVDPKSRVVRILSVNSIWDHQQAVLVLEQQLLELGFQVELKPMSIQAVADALKGEDFDAMVFLSGSGEFDPTYAARFKTGESTNISEYSNPEYDAAVAGGNVDRAKQLLERDVPFTTLYKAVQAVAVDRRFCGVHPKVNYDLSWLADVHLCAAGEAQ